MKKTIILLVSSLLLLCSCGKEKKFDALFADAVDTALETAVLSEKVCNETKSAWSTAIYDHRDPNGDICSDFNDALDVLHENIEKKGTYDEIEEKKSALNSMAKGLSGCPGSRKEAYNELIAFITDINAFANLARCCNPIYGDPITGFVTISRGITIHRSDCPNCQHMKEGMGYRVIPVSWAEQANGQFMQNLRIVGNDDVGIVNNITSIILKEKDIVLRGIDIHSSEDGLFTGNLTIMIDSNTHLKQLINKLKLVKGVKNVSR